MLAHLCGDPALVGLLRQAGSGGADAFNLIASQWLGSGARARLPASPRTCCWRAVSEASAARTLLLLPTASWAPPSLRLPPAAGSPEHVSKADREKAKRVTYGAAARGRLGLSVHPGGQRALPPASSVGAQANARSLPSVHSSHANPQASSTA